MDKDNREILDFSGYFEVWDFWGNRVFEAETRQECEDWLCNNPEEDSE